MDNPEVGNQINDQVNILELSLSNRMPLPVDVIELPSNDDYAVASEPGYAWTGLVELVTGQHFEERPLVALDLCSSVPIYAQLKRHQEFYDCGELSIGLLRICLGSTAKDQKIEVLDSENVQHLQDNFRESKEAINLFVSAVQGVLYTLTKQDFDKKSDLETYIYETLSNQIDIYTHNGGNDEISLDPELSFYKESQPRSYGQVIEILSATIESDKVFNPAEEFIRWQAGILAREIKNNPKDYFPRRIFSLDKAQPDGIVASALKNLPDEIKNYQFFGHAIRSLGDENMHITTDLFEELPFEDNSISQVTCIDGWPYYVDTTNQGLFKEQSIKLLINLYKKLAHSGEIAVFPWSSQSKDGKVLEEIHIELATILTDGFVSKYLLPKTVLKKLVSADDSRIGNISPILADDDIDRFETLVVTKSLMGISEALTYLALVTGLRKPQL